MLIHKTYTYANFLHVQFNHSFCHQEFIYRTRAIKTRSWYETSLDYKPQILGSKIEEFPFLVYK